MSDTLHLERLEEILPAAWERLMRGAADRRSPMHLVVLATSGLEGQPRARTVVLRGADPEERLIRFHTDSRSAKCREIEREPRVGLLGYDPLAALQIRVEGVAVLHRGDKVAHDAWARSRTISRVCYASQPGPGVPIADGAEFKLPPVDSPQVDEGRANFVAIRVRATRLEWLTLSSAGHRRAVFEWDRENRLKAQWLAP